MLKKKEKLQNVAKTLETKEQILTANICKTKHTNFKKAHGITLIALVITIVVLLILAGVSIAMLGGENGLITRAQEAAEETRGASVEEERDLWKANQYLDDYASGSSESLQELIDRLVEQGLLTEDEKDEILGNEEKGIEATGQVTIGSKTIVFGTAGKTLVQAFKDR